MSYEYFSALLVLAPNRDTAHTLHKTHFVVPEYLKQLLRVALDSEPNYRAFSSSPLPALHVPSRSPQSKSIKRRDATCETGSRQCLHCPICQMIIDVKLTLICCASRQNIIKYENY